jgi:hypothetical protein
VFCSPSSMCYTLAGLALAWRPRTGVGGGGADSCVGSGPPAVTVGTCAASTSKNRAEAAASLLNIVQLPAGVLHAFQGSPMAATALGSAGSTLRTWMSG